MTENTIITGIETETVTLADGDRLAVIHGGTLDVDGTAVQVEPDAQGVNVFVGSSGTIDGSFNGVNFANGGQSSGRLTNLGTIRSDSRAVNIGGDGIQLFNQGDIIGTGDQRNGTIYSDGTAENYRIINGRRGTVDAGAGNQGSGIALQTGDVAGDVVQSSLFNAGTIQGRGQAAANTPLAGDGIRIFSGVEGGGTFYQGTLFNRGQILSESSQGATAAIRTVDGLGYRGQVINAGDGVIAGVQNGLYFGNAAHQATVRNFGTISSESRAVNIDGTGVRLFNEGEILGTGDQRNGTVYADATADQYQLNNGRRGVIDAGAGNQGAAISLQTGDVAADVVQASLSNSGTIQGRGQAEASSNLAGDGIRIFSGVAEGGTTFQGDLVNSGEILSESAQGATAAVRIANGVGYQGQITNTRSGVIAGVQNGLYFGDGEHEAIVRNTGRISSDSRAVNIDGTGVNLFNEGEILGTGNQRNGTVYADAPADQYQINNGRQGVIDAGAGNQGAAISLQTGEVAADVVQASLSNSGTIQGRGQAEASSNLAGDGIRIFSGVAEGGTTFQGDLVNRGEILSESAQGATAAVRIANGVGYQGQITNTRSGVIAGVQNGLYFGDGEHEATVRNAGRISSDSRAVNIDGSGVTFINNGDVLGTGDQRNGTVYADATAEDFSIQNGRRGVIDAGVGNQGAGVSLQIGNEADDVVEATLRNDGLIQGRGDAANGSPLAGDGVRLFSGIAEGNVTFQGDIDNRGTIIGSQEGIVVQAGVTLQGEIDNRGTIIAETADGIDLSGTVDGALNNRGTIQAQDAEGIDLNGSDSIFYGDITNFNRGTVLAGEDGIDIDGTLNGDINNRGQIVAGEDGVNIEGTLNGVLNNSGTISGEVNAINAQDAAAAVTVNNRGTLNGAVTLSEFDDVFDASRSVVNGAISGLDGDDLLIGGRTGDVLVGGAGNDTLTGGSGADVFVFAPTDLGADVVTDFQNGLDQLDVSAFNFGAADLQTVIDGAQQLGSDTLLTFAQDNTGLLQNTQVGAIEVTDFVF